MIFVTAGMHYHPFDRLVKKVDELIGAGVLNDEVIMQIGYSKYEPINCQFHTSIPFEDFEKLLDESEIIISHGGAGCIADGLERNKPVVVVPRLRKFGEHSNDHQLGLTDQLAREGRIIAVYDINELESAIEKARHFNPSASKSENRIVKIISDYLAELKH